MSADSITTAAKKIVALILAFSLLVTTAGTAYSQDADTLAPKPASRLIQEYEKELEIFSSLVTPPDIRNVESLRAVWEDIYKGNDRVFVEFVRALQIDDDWASSIARHIASRVTERFAQDARALRGATTDDALLALLREVNDIAARRKIPEFRKKKIIRALKYEFDRIKEASEPAAIAARKAVSNPLPAASRQIEYFVRPHDIETYIETSVLGRMAGAIFGSNELNKPGVLKQVLDAAVAAEIVSYRNYIAGHKPVIERVYGGRAAQRIADAIRIFDSKLGEYASRVSSVILIDESGLPYIDISDADSIIRFYKPQTPGEAPRMVRQFRTRRDISYYPALTYRKFKAAGLLARDGSVRIARDIPDPDAVVRHEVFGHVTNAHLMAANPALYTRIVDSFASLPDPSKESILREFIRIRVNPLYKNEIPGEVLDRFTLARLTELLRNSPEWRQDRHSADGRIASEVNWPRVVDEITSLWAEFSHSLNNLRSAQMKRSGRKLTIAVGDWVGDNKALFRRAGYFDDIEDILRKDASEISSIAWCWGQRLSGFIEEKNEEDGTDFDSGQAYDDVRNSDEDFSRALIDEIEKGGIGDVDTADKDGLAGQLSDDIVEGVFFNEIVPGINENGLGAIDIGTATKRIAEQLKARLFQDSGEVSVARITDILNKPEIQEKLKALVERIARYTVLSARAKNSAGGAGAAGETAAPAAAARQAVASATRSRGQTHSHGAVTHSHHPPRGGAFSPARTPASPAADELPPYLKDMTKEAADGKLDEVYFRDDEIREMKKILNRKESPNVLLFGDRGVGKTALVVKLSLEISRGEAGYGLEGYRVLSLDPAGFIAASGGTPDGFGKLVQDLIVKVSDGKTILFMDEMHLFSDRRGIPGVTSNFFQYLKAPLAEGRIRVIGATTLDEYKTDIEPDKALVSRFTPLEVKPPSVRQAIDILLAIRERYEASQNKAVSDPDKKIVISEDAAVAAVNVSERVLKTEPLLRKATKALDEASAAVRTRQDEIESRIRETKRNIVFYSNQLRKSRSSGNRQRIAELIPRVNKEVRKLIEILNRKEEGVDYTVGPADILEAFIKFGIPPSVVNETERHKVEGLDAYLRANLKGQDAAVEAVVAAVKRSYVNQNRKRPIGTFFMAGPTGSGKTELARLLARYLFDSADPEKDGCLIRVDLSQYAEPHRISQLIGAPPGYVGYAVADTLLERVRRKPYSVVLLDEADKCNPSILTKVFLPIMEDGSTRTPSGEPVDFSNTIIIFTSNFGMQTRDYARSDAEIAAAIGQAKLRMPPEFWNRMQEPVVYRGLDRETVADIVKNVQLRKLVERYAEENKVEIEYEDIGALTDIIINKGFSPLEGARGIAKAVEGLIDNPISDMLLEGRLREKEKVIIACARDADGKYTGELKFDIKDGIAPAEVSRLSSADLVENAILSDIETVIGNTDITIEALDAFIDVKPAGLAEKADFKPRAALVVGDPAGASISGRFGQHIPNRRDEELDKAFSEEAIRKALTDGRYVADDEIVRLISTSLRRVVNEAKRQNRDMLSRLIAKTDEYRRLEADAGRNPEWRRQILELAEKARVVSVRMFIEADMLKVSVEYPSALSLAAEERLIRFFGHDIRDRTDVSKTPRDDRPVAEARYDVAALRGVTGYEKRGGVSAIWFTIPLRKYTPPETGRRAGVPPDEFSAGTAGPQDRLAALNARIAKIIAQLAEPDADEAAAARSPGAVSSVKFLRDLSGKGIAGSHRKPVLSASFSSDGKRIVSGSEDNTIKIWDAGTGRLLNTLEGHKSPVRSVSFSSDGKRIASGGYDNMIKIWDADTGRLLNTLEGHENPVMSASFSSDGKRIVSGSSDNTIKIWDADTGRLLNTFEGHKKTVWSVSFSSDGKRIVSGGYDNMIKIWDADTGRLLNTLEGHKSTVWSASFSFDGKRIVSGSSDNTIKTWDADTGRLLNTLRGHKSHVWSVSFSSDGKRIVSGSEDSTIKIWDAGTGRLLNTLEGHKKPVMSASFSSDGNRIVSGSSETSKDANGEETTTGVLRLHKIEYEAPINRAIETRPKPESTDLSLLPDGEEASGVQADLAALMRGVAVHKALGQSPEVGKRVAVIVADSLFSAGCPDGALGESLRQHYQAMKQGLRRVFGGGSEELFFVVRDSDALAAQAGTLMDRGIKVIILDDGSFTGSAAADRIGARADTEYCVVSALVGRASDDRSFAFVNVNAMAMMGMGIIERDTALFETAYRIFTGEDAPPGLKHSIEQRALRIIQAIPRVVTLTDRLGQSRELSRLFATAA